MTGKEPVGKYVERLSVVEQEIAKRILEIVKPLGYTQRLEILGELMREGIDWPSE